MLEGLQAAVGLEVKRRTKIWADAFGFNAKPDLNKSEKAKGIEKILADKAFGKSNSSYVALMSVLTGEPLTSAKPPVVPFGSGVMVVPLGCTNGHNYEIGKPIFNNAGSSVFYKVDGNTGNTMTPKGEELRPATEEEINKFFSQVSLPTISSFISLLVSYPYQL